MSKIQVGINGYGVIGKRVADAILLQPDMELVGVADIATDWRIKSVANRLPLFASTEDAKGRWSQLGCDRQEHSTSCSSSPTS